MYIVLDGHFGLGYNRAIGPFKSKLQANRHCDGLGGDPIVMELIHSAETEGEDKYIGIGGSILSGFCVFGVFNSMQEAEAAGNNDGVSEVVCLPLVDAAVAELEEATSNE
jgi:hypothetical protein